MTPILRIKCHASGLFAMNKEIKVLQGDTLGLLRNPSNQHGMFSVARDTSWLLFIIINSNDLKRYKTDSNCIQLLALVDSCGDNCGKYTSNEHIGHISKEFSSTNAPILDQVFLNACEDYIAFRIEYNSILYSLIIHHSPIRCLLYTVSRKYVGGNSV